MIFVTHDALCIGFIGYFVGLLLLILPLCSPFACWGIPVYINLKLNNYKKMWQTLSRYRVKDDIVNIRGLILTLDTGKCFINLP